MDKKQSRIRRSRRTRAKIRDLGVHRLCVYRTSLHTYAQIFSPDGSSVVASASTLEADIKSALKHTGNVEAATKIGQMIAERAKSAGVKQVAFDRSGLKYHGRVKALADAARESGLKI